jgi:hypothetical protein
MARLTAETRIAASTVRKIEAGYRPPLRVAALLAAVYERDSGQPCPLQIFLARRAGTRTNRYNR